MATSPFHSAFNKILIEFIQNLETTFPEEQDFKLFRSGLQEVVKHSMQTPAKLFNKFCQPIEIKNKNGEKDTLDIEKEILNNNQELFLQYDYLEYVKDIQTDTKIFDFISKIQTYWTKLTSSGKDTVMKYLKSLVTLNKKIEALKKPST